MNVERVELSNFGSWRALSLALEPGVTLISGANGVGKSTILQAIEFALFGATGDAGRLIRRGADEARVSVYLEDGLVVTRSVRRSGSSAKVSLSLHRGVDDASYDSLTAATVTETQATLDGLLGVSRELLRSSAFSMQGDGAAFCEAAPRDRKRIFSTTLGLEFWDALAVDAKRDATTASAQAQAARARLEQLAGAEQRLLRAREEEFAAHERKKGVAEDERNAEAEVARLAGEAEAAREARRRHATATEAAQRARADHKRATAETAAAQESLERTRAAAANAPSVDDAVYEASEAAGALAEAEVLHAARTREAQEHADQLAQARRDLATANRERANRQEIASVAERTVREVEAAGECPTCGKPLDDDTVLERLQADLRSALAGLTAAEHPVGHAHAEIMRLDAEPPAGIPDATLAAARAAAGEAQRKLAEAQTIHSLAGSIEAAEQRMLLAAARQSDTSEIAYFADEAALETAREAEATPTDIEARHATALKSLEQVRVAHRQAAAALAAAEAAAKTAERDAADEQAARARFAEAELEAAIAGILAAGFGPQGVPAMIVDGVLADLALEANRVLAELASPIRVDLRSQKLLKTSDRLADTLDIIALMDAQETPWERLSGGERTRVAIALRAALTRLLASKRGARVRILVIDEPAGLDRDGSENLAGVLREFVTAGVFDTVLLVTHQTELADQIGRVIRVQRAPGGDSRLAESTAGSLSPQTPSSDPAEHRDRKAARVS